MNMQVSESGFDNELSDFIVALDSFPKLPAPSSSTSVNVPRPAQTRRTLTLAMCKQARSTEINGRQPDHCPDSIARLCNPTLPGKAVAAPSSSTTNNRSSHVNSERQETAAQLLVALDDTVFELNIVSAELARQQGWRLDGDLVKTWSDVFCTGSKFRLVSSLQHFQQLCLRLSSMHRKDVRSAINACDAASLLAKGYSLQTIFKIKLLSPMASGDWEQLCVRLRPSRINAPSQQSLNSMSFTRCQEAEIRSTESYRLARQNLQQLWFPMPSSCKDLVQTRS
ncbi:hypothetical protein P3T42_005265 [Paraburkholderia sp. GAS38]|jgi:hypothetical protein|uniref:hypothetical protein n=1 Tax=Paraburkholderia sp. GAS38 TaxID=3035133 RepID=UPI003D20FEA9